MKNTVATAIGFLVGLMLFAPLLRSQQAADKEIRFRATVQSLVTLAGFQGEIAPAAVDPRFALTMRIETSVSEAPEFAAGKVMTFAIHSPSRLFAGEPKNGETFDFILYGKLQDGKVRYFGLGRGYPAMMDSAYPRYAVAQKYAAIGVEPIGCFAGLVRVKGKRIPRQAYLIYSPNADMKCCGTVVKNAQTDDHGHFLVEPMEAGEYIAQFEVNGVAYFAPFAIVNDYKEFSAEYVELDFSDVSSFKFQQYVIVDDLDGDCRRVASEAHCFRR